MRLLFIVIIVGIKLANTIIATHIIQKVGCTKLK